MSNTIMEEVERIRNLEKTNGSLRVDSKLAHKAQQILKLFLGRSFIEHTEDFVVFGLGKEETIIDALNNFEYLNQRLQSKHHTAYNWAYHDDSGIWIFIFEGHDPEFDRESNLLNIYLAYSSTDKQLKEVYRCKELGLKCEQIMTCIKKGKVFEVEDGCEFFVYKMNTNTNYTDHLRTLFQEGYVQQEWKKFNMITWKEKNCLTVVFLFFLRNICAEIRTEKENILNKLNDLRSNYGEKIKLDNQLNLRAAFDGNKMIYKTKEELSEFTYIYFSRQRDDYFAKSEMREILKNGRIDKFGVHCVPYFIDEQEYFAWVFLFGTIEKEQLYTTIKRNDLTPNICEMINGLTLSGDIENTRELNEEAQNIYDGLVKMNVKLTTKEIVCFKSDDISPEILKDSNVFEIINTIKVNRFGYYWDKTSNHWTFIFNNPYLLRGKNKRENKKVLSNQCRKCIFELLNLYREINGCKRLLQDVSMVEFISTKMKRLAKGEIIICDYNILTLNCSNFEDLCRILLDQDQILEPTFAYCGIEASDAILKGKCSLAIGLSRYAEDQRKLLLTTRQILLKKMNAARILYGFNKVKNNKEMERMATKRLEHVLNKRPYLNNKDSYDFASFILNDQLEAYTSMVTGTDLYLNKVYKEVGIAQMWGFMLIYFSPRCRYFNRCEAGIKLFNLDGLLNIREAKQTRLTEEKLQSEKDSIHLHLEPLQEEDSMWSSDEFSDTEDDTESAVEENGKESLQDTKPEGFSKRESNLTELTEDEEDYFYDCKDTLSDEQTLDEIDEKAGFSLETIRKPKEMSFAEQIKNKKLRAVGKKSNLASENERNDVVGRDQGSESNQMSFAEQIKHQKLKAVAKNAELGSEMNLSSLDGQETVLKPKEINFNTLKKVETGDSESQALETNGMSFAEQIRNQKLKPIAKKGGLLESDVEPNKLSLIEETCDIEDMNIQTDNEIPMTMNGNSSKHAPEFNEMSFADQIKNQKLKPVAKKNELGFGTNLKTAVSHERNAESNEMSFADQIKNQKLKKRNLNIQSDLETSDSSEQIREDLNEINFADQIKNQKLKPVAKNSRPAIAGSEGDEKPNEMNLADQIANQKLRRVEPQHKAGKEGQVNQVNFLEEMKKKKLEKRNQDKTKPKNVDLNEVENGLRGNDSCEIFNNSSTCNATSSRTTQRPSELHEPEIKISNSKTKPVTFTVDSSQAIEHVMNKIKTEHSELVQDLTTVSIAKNLQNHTTIISFSNEQSVDKSVLSVINKRRREEDLVNLLPSKRLCEICLDQLVNGYESKRLNYGLFDCLVTSEADKTCSAFVTFCTLLGNSENVKELILREDLKYFGMASKAVDGRDLNVWAFCFTSSQPE